MDWYNGYSPEERSAMDRAVGPPSAKAPPCAICGDGKPLKMQTHAEDYSTPYRWNPPAAYPVCIRCHSRLHSRFRNPPAWKSFLEVLRRGWYAREVSSEDLNRLARLGATYPSRELPHEAPVRKSADLWWESLSTDKCDLEIAHSSPPTIKFVNRGKMGSTSIASCPCGFVSSELLIGCGMDGPDPDFFPAYCEGGRHLVELNLCAHPCNCPAGHPTEPVPYNDKSLIGTIGQTLPSHLNLFGDPNDRVLTDGSYLCPECQQFTLTFREGGSVWD